MRAGKEDEDARYLIHALATGLATRDQGRPDNRMRASLPVMPSPFGLAARHQAEGRVSQGCTSAKRVSLATHRPLSGSPVFHPTCARAYPRRMVKGWADSTPFVGCAARRRPYKAAEKSDGL